MSNTPNLGLPLILLGALWGAVSIVLQSYRMINAKRDRIMTFIECRKALAGEVKDVAGGLVPVPEKVLDQCAICCFGKELQPVDLYLSNLLPLSLDDVARQYPDLRVPTLIVWGRQDEIVPLSVGERLHQAIPGSQLSVIDGSGHSPAEERPQALLPLLEDFLRHPEGPSLAPHKARVRHPIRG